MISDWQKDPSSHQDPYQDMACDYSLLDMEKELEDLPAVHGGDKGAFEQELTETGFLIQGLELEAEQYVIRCFCAIHLTPFRLNVRNLRSTTSQGQTQAVMKLKEQESILHRRITKWLILQGAFMPRAVRYRESSKTLDHTSSH